MDMTGEYRLNASREAVYDALNDPEILKQCIPGCEEIEKTSDTEMTAKVVAKVGPVKAKFNGAVTLSDLNRPESYSISGEGKGGAAGFAKGGAKVRLEEDGEGTLMHYEVHADIGGKLAQLGSRLIDGTAKKMAKDFFETFAGLVDGGKAETSEAVEAQEAAKPVAPAAPPTEEAAPATTSAAEEAASAPAAPPASPPEPEKSGGLSPMVWVVGVILLAAVAVLISLS
ncbi:carbon monoxide dehydrogenase subunit G [Denitrobaculum tricleocarpae]|uniref:Carbon monoxide dehydrogenase subunit G n=2 Tax=Denitrobaculum tricleocarpae TaxID=2591009 RepID=A0A545T5R3_9PROT|nr:carbon monoxide dehydrogenase subunit G [Denitrobaculum tricleocarpae]TQV72515.1 carbon monoxide dehydrogenase subunit G [Denitrobaculum tricleocarpae]